MSVSYLTSLPMNITNLRADSRVRLHFAQAGLDRTAINTVYSHVLNPMITSRSYMSIEPIELRLDPRALRRGLVYPVDPDTNPNALLVQDSGMVPVSTQIAIINPETCHLCHVGEYGEIWVRSEACAKAFYMSRQEFDLERFNGRIVGGDPRATYVRTGDLGFLHTVARPIGAGGQPVEMQVLFNLGSIGETFEVNGLNHFPMDIENSVEKCHRNISPGGSAVFQAGGLVVVLVEVFRKAYLASIVPVIVDAILNEHQLVVDMIAFVSHGDFPRSRLGEKQRGKILASWVTRKLRTIAQFGIRDPETENQITEVPEPQIRPNNASMRSKSINTRGDMVRNSIVSEFPANPPSEASPGFTEGRIMSSDRTSHATPRQDDGAQDSYNNEVSNPPMVALNDQPYPIPENTSVMSLQPDNDHSHIEADYFDDDNRFYDPNADPYHPYAYDDTTPQASTSGTYIPAENRLPCPSVTNPSELATYSEGPTPTTNAVSNPESNSALAKTQTSYFAGISPGATTTTAASSTQSAWISDPPYQDPGKLSTGYYDAGRSPVSQNAPIRTSSLDFDSTPLSRPAVKSPPPTLPAQATPQPLPNPTAWRGRATLPSQQKSRYSSYGSISGSTGLRVINQDPPSSSDEDAQSQNGDEQTKPVSKEKLLDLPRPSLQEDRDEVHRNTGEFGRPESRLSDAGSVAGSVRRRYDGSGYDEW